MVDYEDITIHVNAGIATITINRPTRLNAFRNQTADELHDALKRAETDPETRAVILTGAGRAFGAGYDLAQINPSEVPALENSTVSGVSPSDGVAVTFTCGAEPLIA